ncbi:unnamed protein product [Mytilus coruscus]|uniref:Uncharacterized protein n=1 Tax=Mytilus coruscus TaxID=42192 RepID=A0A6J8E6L0_MYTCO|nr:unnamed protein product [Mytilus coruscus]
MMMTVNGLLSITECCLHSTIDKCLQIKPFIEGCWNLETIGIKDCPYTSDDENTLSNFITSLKIRKWKISSSLAMERKLLEFHENRELAYGRLKLIIHKMKNNHDQGKYDEINQNQCRKGIIIKVSNHCSIETGIEHNIPHHAVVDLSKSTTKSLNDCLHRGSVMLQNFCGLLLRFRMNKITAVADIEKAFLQIERCPAFEVKVGQINTNDVCS